MCCVSLGGGEVFSSSPRTHTMQYGIDHGKSAASLWQPSEWQEGLLYRFRYQGTVKRNYVSSDTTKRHCRAGRLGCCTRSRGRRLRCRNTIAEPKRPGPKHAAERAGCFLSRHIRDLSDAESCLGEALRRVWDILVALGTTRLAKTQQYVIGWIRSIRDGRATRHRGCLRCR